MASCFIFFSLISTFLLKIISVQISCHETETLNFPLHLFAVFCWLNSALKLKSLHVIFHKFFSKNVPCSRFEKKTRVSNEFESFKNFQFKLLQLLLLQPKLISQIALAKKKVATKIVYRNNLKQICWIYEKPRKTWSMREFSV